ncbi:hypothetical protein [uncultured Clostridium sp.]|uniref:hypothetical protein n=1 Tax=uncultured Clostridium sp. TaxID=59620 RepID=UPI00205D6DDE|nr:hypothetical protein [uncultured Clostridium sp.]DAK99868.1 MAG TPA: hypothetical protein [Caudoviricetes sp.]
MLDVKGLLEQTGLKVGEVAFLKPPALPYIIILEDKEELGADQLNNIIKRDINIELYSEKINKPKEEEIESLLKTKSIKYKSERVYIDSQKIFETIYTFSIYEKERGVY